MDQHSLRMQIGIHMVQMYLVRISVAYPVVVGVLGLGRMIAQVEPIGQR